MTNLMDDLETVDFTLKMMRVFIHQPAGGSETTLVGLVLGILMDCEVSNIHNTTTLEPTTHLSQGAILDVWDQIITHLNIQLFWSQI